MRTSLRNKSNRHQSCLTDLLYLSWIQASADVFADPGVFHIVRVAAGVASLPRIRENPRCAVAVVVAFWLALPSGLKKANCNALFVLPRRALDQITTLPDALCNARKKERLNFIVRTAACKRKIQVASYYRCNYYHNAIM